MIHCWFQQRSRKKRKKEEIKINDERIMLKVLHGRRKRIIKRIRCWIRRNNTNKIEDLLKRKEKENKIKEKRIKRKI